MRTIVIVVTTLLMLAACSQASRPTPTSSAPPTAAAAENVEQLLSKMEQDWADALVKGDASFHESILADDYVGISPDGTSATKNQSVNNVRSGAFKAEFMTIDGVKVRTFGDVAIVTYGQSEKSQSQGKDTSGRSLWTDIFVKRNGKWQIVANHGSKVEEPKK